MQLNNQFKFPVIPPALKSKMKKEKRAYGDVFCVGQVSYELSCFHTTRHGCGIHTWLGQLTLSALTISMTVKYRLFGYLVWFMGLYHLYNYIKCENVLLIQDILWIKYFFSSIALVNRDIYFIYHTIHLLVVPKNPYLQLGPYMG